MLVCRRVVIPLKADHLNVGSNSLPPPCLLCLSAPHGLSLVAGSRPWRILQRPAIASLGGCCWSSSPSGPSVPDQRGGGWVRVGAKLLVLSLTKIYKRSSPIFFQSPIIFSNILSKPSFCFQIRAPSRSILSILSL